MAVTKIKPIHSTLKAAINYIINPKKTEGQVLVHSFGCSPETAHLEFALTSSTGPSSLFTDTGYVDGISLEKGKEGKKERKPVLAYHVIQSFKPEEISKELAHELGQAFAKTITNGSHEYIVATHVDRHHIHNHILFNAVDFKTKKKYHSNYQSYKMIRACSDSLCAEHGLSVITTPMEKGKTYYEWLMNKEGKSYKEALRKDLDSCIKTALSFDELLVQMNNLGYEVKFGKYLAFKAPGSEKFTRTKSLGNRYTEEKIRDRILEKIEKYNPENIRDFKASSTPYLGLLSSVEGAIAMAGKNPATARSDLKKLNATYLFLKEAGIHSLEELSLTISENTSKTSQVRNTIHQLEVKQEMYESFLKHAASFMEFKEVYAAYKSSGFSIEFEHEHRREIMLFELSSSFLKTSPLWAGSLKNISKIKKEQSLLQQKIDASYDELNQYKDREKQLTKVRKNIEAILSENALEKDKEGDTNKVPKKPEAEGKGNKIPVIE